MLSRLKRNIQSEYVYTHTRTYAQSKHKIRGRNKTRTNWKYWIYQNKISTF